MGWITKLEGEKKKKITSKNSDSREEDDNGLRERRVKKWENIIRLPFENDQVLVHKHDSISRV